MELTYPVWDVQERKYFWSGEDGKLRLGTADEWEQDMLRRFNKELSFMRLAMDAAQMRYAMQEAR